MLAKLDLDRTVPPVSHRFRGGTSEAKRLLREFLTEHLPEYEESRPHPETTHVSHMSKYLHFGQVSPVQVALAAREAKAADNQRESFLEELIVRRELAQNFAEYSPHYDSFECVPEWARKTLDKHRGDERHHQYTQQQLERARTHDPYWNAAMREMRYTGYMHNAMRMYWGKKILEWSSTPEHAHRTALALNNRYFLDGRDANSYANVGWLFGLHDRPWGERRNLRHRALHVLGRPGAQGGHGGLPREGGPARGRGQGGGRALRGRLTPVSRARCSRRCARLRAPWRACSVPGTPSPPPATVRPSPAGAPGSGSGGARRAVALRPPRRPRAG